MNTHPKECCEKCEMPGYSGYEPPFHFEIRCRDASCPCHKDGGKKKCEHDHGNFYCTDCPFAITNIPYAQREAGNKICPQNCPSTVCTHATPTPEAEKGWEETLTDLIEGKTYDCRDEIKDIIALVRTELHKAEERGYEKRDKEYADTLNHVIEKARKEERERCKKLLDLQEATINILLQAIQELRDK